MRHKLLPQRRLTPPTRSWRPQRAEIGWKDVKEYESRLRKQFNMFSCLPPNTSGYFQILCGFACLRWSVTAVTFLNYESNNTENIGFDKKIKKKKNQSKQKKQTRKPKPRKKQEKNKKKTKKNKNKSKKNQNLHFPQFWFFFCFFLVFFLFLPVDLFFWWFCFCFCFCFFLFFYFFAKIHFLCSTRGHNSWINNVHTCFSASGFRQLRAIMIAYYYHYY